MLELGERTVLYWHLIRWFPRFANHSFAYLYVLSSIGVLSVILATAHWWSVWDRGVRVLVCLVPLWVMWDISRWWLDLLIDRRHGKLVSRERNVLFLALNLLELVFIGGIFFEAAGLAGDSADAWFAAFFLVSQLDFPNGLIGFWDLAAAALVEATALLLLLGGLAVLVELLGSKLYEGTWHGPDMRDDPDLHESSARTHDAQ